jgi:hypothetical protein
MSDFARRKGDAGLVTALAGGQTIRDAARASGVSEATVYRRLEDPAFRQQVAEARGKLIDGALGQLADASTQAVTTLRALLGAEGELVRLGSARAILELGHKLRESVEMEARIAALEQRSVNG